MRKEQFSGDFLGFTFKGVHSSELYIFRSSNPVISEQILPQVNDVTTTVTKGQGSTYYGSTYTQKNLTIDFAFQGLTEEDIKKIKMLFNDQQIGKLIYDESPYKSYRAKASGTSVIKHLAFVGDDQQRYYNGTGSISFVCYFPYAISEFSELTEEVSAEPWVAVSGIPIEGQYGVINDQNKTQIYNAGDEEMLMKMVIDLSDYQDKDSVTINMTYNLSNQEEQSTFSLVNLPTKKQYVCVDFFRANIYGYDVEGGRPINCQSLLAYMEGDFISIGPKEIINISFDGSSLKEQTESITNFANIVKFDLQYLYI